MKVEGRVILISGASSGIGEALAIACAKRGARGVGLMARRLPALEKAAAAVEAAGAESLVIAADVGRNEDVLRAVEATLSKWGSLDIVVANAGVGSPLSALEPDQASLEQVMNINLLGAARLFNAALPHMLSVRRGQLVGISSLAGLRGMPRGGAYCASKAALNALLESYRVELHLAGITVSTIQPGYVRTELVAKSDIKPFLSISAEAAAEASLRALEANRRVTRFPAIHALLMGGLAQSPGWLFDRITRFMARDNLKLPPPALPPPQRATRDGT